MNNYSFKKYQPLSLRLWHWFNALVILGLLGTAFLRKSFLSWRTNAALIESKMQEAGAAITPDLAKDIAIGIRTPMWDWHYVLGFTLGGLMLVRVLVGIFAVKKCPATHAAQSAWNLRKVPAGQKANALHYTIVKTGYALFYLVTVFMVVSGVVMYFKTELGISKEALNPVKEFHELMMWFFTAFVVGHILGLVIAENRQDKGLVSDMIHGGPKD
ncbi:cytochrome b/b6 domain-containing protein [Bdellovibrio bacteriovorus]|uniref:Putative Ni,Fe-hydrogenase I cytochrome b subunit n=1 Tax=Bdellovibrio bacteriovorus str. Tiberius TaxID=1069642 RepID=K7Z987_BDEBC|nr:cytochrome b/b6 domain-containing protein [Bdellovibrio bacteriovorus]AFY01089.1 putative Ni,Fe-hydrogenase I cytochrome b subunit [Bdellovibrio bacteriovorus str. Tiberius]